jgi:hypothetical protein
MYDRCFQRIAASALGRKVVDVAVEKPVFDVAADDFERRPDGGGDGLDEGGLAAARLPGEPVDLVSFDFEGNVIDGAHLANDTEVAHQIVGPQVLDRQRSLHNH